MIEAHLAQLIQTLSVMVIPALLAITCHEAAHGIVAYWLGDDTAYRQGRVTLNPIRHIDPFGTIALPLLLSVMSMMAGRGPILFGYAKPVPTNPSRMRHPRRDMILVALAGPGMNLLLAIIGAALYYTLPWLPGFAVNWVHGNLEWLVVLNLVIGLFNLIPVPPLDGSHIVIGLLPRNLAIRFAQLGRFGILLVLLLFFVLPQLSDALNLAINPFSWLILGPMDWIAAGIFHMLGLSY